MRVSFDLQSEAGIRNYGEFVERAADLVVSYGGSLSGEHGDGQSRGALLPKMFGPELMNAFRQFKAVWDPHNKMNPHKVVDAYLPTENLRLGADYKPLQPKTHFKFVEDGGSFANAAARCIGVGTCRKQDSGSMCPSYMVTLEEEHSTRGRAHMLFELLQGEVIDGAWKNEQVKQALDLCLACKACKSECPANVDLATYKAEFLSHYYEAKRRPLHAYAFGMIDRWAALGSFAPRVANLLSNAPSSKRWLQKALDLAPQRQMPQLRYRQLSEVGLQATRVAKDGRPGVLLWPDTFNNYFKPETSQAAFEVLTHAGFSVNVPQSHLCCGRPFVRLWHARQGQAIPAARHASASAGDRRRLTHRDPGAELRVGISRRTAQPLSRGCACRTPAASDLPAQRVSATDMPISLRNCHKSCSFMDIAITKQS